MPGIYAKFFVLAILFFGAVSGRSHGQGLSKTDSLKQEIGHAKTDTDKVKLWVGLSNATGCDDTSQRSKYASEALQMAEKIKWLKGLVIANIAKGLFYSDCKTNYPLSIKYYQQADSLSKLIGEVSINANALQFIANDYYELAEYGKALDYYRSALALKSSPDFAMAVFGNMGLIYSSVGDYPRALSYYDSSLQMLDAYTQAQKKSILQDTMQRMLLLMTIADVYIAMKQYDKALDNYNNALTLVENTTRKPSMHLALTGIGKTYMYKKEPAKAIEYYLMALDERKQNDQYTIDVLNELGNAYLMTGDMPKAMSYAQRALQVAHQYSDSAQVPRIHTTMGKILSAQKNYAQAASYLQNAILICAQQGALNDEKEAWEALSNTYERMKQPANALDAFRHYIALRDSIYNVDKARELVRIDLQSGFKTLKLADSLRQDEAKKVILLSLQRQRAVSIGGFAGLMLALTLMFFIFRNYTQQKKANRTISTANAAIQKEKQVSESLLLNILPEEVALELKANGKVLAKSYNDVTVLFTDFVDFTKAGEHMSAQQLVAELDTCFQAFDMIIEKYNIEKIKTVGDGYLAVSGLPKANPDHAANVVKAAIEIRDYIAARKQAGGHETFQIRMGINSGSAVAGIVGARKFAYDIWGDTVNTAARMEQTCEAGNINVSQATYELVKDKFAFVYRGEIEAKGKGLLKMYYVV